MQIEFGTVAVSAGIQSIVGLILYFAVRRQVEKVDVLTDQVTDLKDKQLADTNERLGRHIEKESESRKELYGRVGNLERNSVPADLCRQTHRELAQGQQEFRAAVIDLAGVQQQITNVSRFISDVNERQIALGQDLAEMRGRMNGGKGVAG